MVVREPRAGAAAARTTRCSAPSVAAPANMLPPSFPAPGKHILGVVFFLIVSDTVPKHGFSSRVADYFAGS